MALGHGVLRGSRPRSEINWAWANAKGLTLTVDGIFGFGTYNETREFQGCVGLRGDGIIGPLTWSKLNYWVNQPDAACG
jgi:peptidoglycan hydrolase-like protein with peptidoglycan-binding domain